MFGCSLNMIRIILISFLVSVSCVTESLAAGCPDVQGIENFNLTGVSEGLWYEIGRYQYDVEIATSCVVVRTRPVGDGFVGESINVPSTSPEFLRGECNIVDDNGRGVLNFTISSGGEPQRVRLLPEVKMIYDGEGNLISYSCLEDESKNKEEFAWIFSRKQDLLGEDKENIFSTVRSLDVLDINKFIWIDQSQCN